MIILSFLERNANKLVDSFSCVREIEYFGYFNILNSIGNNCLECVAPKPSSIEG